MSIHRREGECCGSRTFKGFLTGAAIAPIILSLLCPAPSAASSSAGHEIKALQKGFEAPPESAKPRVWWHWMNGNITEDGIKKDLAWMHRVGVGGMNAIDASIATPQVVKKRLVYMSPGWKHAFRYTAHLATKYGMELSIDSSPGWSETGGPWVSPQQAMKKMVWSATAVAGGHRFDGKLPQPPSTTGPIQNAHMRGFFGPSKTSRIKFYRDSAVIAYRAPVVDPKPVAAVSNAGPVDAAALSDGDLTNGPALTAKKGSAWIVIRYAHPVRVQGLTLDVSAVGAPGAVTALEVSNDGKTFRAVAQMPGADAPRRGFPQQTISFAPVTGQFFRLKFSAAPPGHGIEIFNHPAPGAVPMNFMARMRTRGPLTFKLHEAVLHARATVNAFEAKADFAIVSDYYKVASKSPIVPGSAVKAGDVVDLTGRMTADGRLDWTPPSGKWVVLRLGYSLEGTTNHPATAEATGLEVDKLNARHVKSYMEHYLDTYKAITGRFGANSVRAMTVDSTEVGMQNWTENILADFKKMRGYDPTPWLPTLTGVVVGTPAQSDKFLWDFRRTINELLAKNHYGEIGKIARQRGLVNYGEALESHRPTFGDDMEMRQYTSIPMAAMWTYGARREPFPTYLADIHGAASVSHIYGQNLVAAESMTSAAQPWAFAPQELKPVIDMELAAGVNRVVIHTSVHQPLDKPPGLSLGPFGQFFNRLESWANEAGPWVKYIARSSYLLQQGHYAADIAYFYGQEAPITSLFGDKTIDVPGGYGFDFVNSDVLENMLSVDDGKLVTKSGMRYRVLYLGGSSRMMTLHVLRRILSLVQDGATVVGRRPVASPSLKDDPAAFRKIADALFGTSKGASVRHVGKGEVFASWSLRDALASLKQQPDFEYTRPEADTELRFIHRRIDHGDIYFITNRLNRSESVTATFRVAGLRPELWDAVTGKVSQVGYKMRGRRTSMALHLPAYGSVFVVFRGSSRAGAQPELAKTEHTLWTLSGPWKVAFEPDRGAPAEATFDSLTSWSKSSNSGVKYFSGTGTYSKTFELPAHKKGARLLLNLGSVKELARVSLNGHSLGEVWTPPFEVDITKYVHPGKNALKVAVTNLWVNRLIGDLQPHVKKKYTFTTIPTYKPNAPLRSSGLLGPVEIKEVARH